MSFPSYPKYKDSGVEWLGSVPEHWGVGSLRWLTRRYSGGTPDKTNLAYWEDGTIPWLNSGAVNDRTIAQPSTYITAEAFANSSAKWIPKDSLVMALAGQGKTKGRVAQLAIPSTCNQSMAAIIPDSEVDARFLFWWLDSNYQNIRNMAGGDLRDGLNLELLGNIQCPLPLHTEQAQIAAFLDRETAMIDELVAEQRRLMDLLKEKRQAVISHAVTKGLNPDAPMKPSGIEWLGDVPAHWDAAPIKYVAKIGNGSTPSREVPEYWGETGFPWLNSSVVNFSEVTEAEGFVTQRALRECHLPVISPPAILVGITGQGRTRGMAAMLGIEATINQHVAYIKPTTAALDVRYLLRILESAYMKLRRDSEEAGATKGAITCEQIGNLPIPLPPFADQSAICAFLDTETAKLDTLTAEAQRAIDLLQERRTALISAAVTGQIDVRQLADQRAA